MDTQSIRPGDVVVLSVDRRLSAVHWQRLREKIKEQIPDNRVLILEPGMKLETLRPKITLVDLDDWIAVYIDGTKVAEQHSFYAHDLLAAVGVEFERIEADYAWVFRHGLPDKLSEIPEDKRKAI